MNKKSHTERLAKHETRRDQYKQHVVQEVQKQQTTSRKPKNFTRTQKVPKEIELLKKRKEELIAHDREEVEEEDEDKLLALVEQRRKEEQDLQGDDLIQIEHGLFLGSLKQAKNQHVLERFEITHVLTCLKGVTRKDILKEKEGEEHILHKIIEVEDLDTEDFATHFDECVDFIRDALLQHSNNILVHDSDRAMMSCSSTAILAYFIREKKLGVEEGLQILKDLAPDVEPNEGFKRQLNRYYVKQRRLQREESERQDTEKPKQLSASELREQRKQELAKQREDTTKSALSNDQETFAYCKRCRFPLFSTADLVSHTDETEMSGVKGFSFKKVKKDAANSAISTNKCSSLFIKRCEWMGEMLDTEGKLVCPKCAARVGSYSWVGSQCSCGMWVNPSFAVLKTRVD
jgi:dual specificity phosphatase 12